MTNTQTEKGFLKITTSYDRGRLQSDKINAPMFLPESGVDCGSNLDMLKENLHASMLSDTGKIDPTLANIGNKNSLVRVAYVLSLMVKK